MIQPGYDIDVITEVETPPSLPPLLEATIAATLTAQGVTSPAELSLLLADDARLHSLNLEFLGEDKVTDVLSFPAGDPMPGLPVESGAGYLGDLAISLPAAVRQASAAGHTAAAECQLLVVHGTLHLLGYDHSDPEQKTAMWLAQSQVLEALGVQVTVPE